MSCPDPWLSLSACAERAGVNRASVWRWARRGVRGVRLAATMAGGAWRIRASALETFLNALTERATAGAPAPVCDPAGSPDAVRERAKAARELMRRRFGA